MAPRSSNHRRQAEVTRQLYAALQACQRRLGTDDERPDDFGRVLELAHRINNQLTAEYLERAVESLPGLAPTRVVIGRRMLRR